MLIFYMNIQVYFILKKDPELELNLQNKLVLTNWRNHHRLFKLFIFKCMYIHMYILNIDMCMII